MSFPFLVTREASWDKSFDADGLTALALRLRNGHVSAEGWEQAEVAVHVNIQARAFSEEEAQSRLNAVNIEFTRDGAALFGEVQSPPTVLGGVSTHFTIWMPRPLALEFHTSNGNIDVTGMTARLSLQTSNGNIVAESAQGPAVLKTSNGNVELTGDNSMQAVQLSTSNGDVCLTGFAGGGNLETSNGDIDLELAENSGVRLDLRTSHGRISVLGDQSRRGNHLTLALGGGGPLFRASTSNGNVRVTGSLPLPAEDDLSSFKQMVRPKVMDAIDTLHAVYDDLYGSDNPKEPHREGDSPE